MSLTFRENASNCQKPAGAEKKFQPNIFLRLKFLGSLPLIEKIIVNPLKPYINSNLKGNYHFQNSDGHILGSTTGTFFIRIVQERYFL